MYCNSCGTKNKKNSDFCAKCGSKLENGSVPASSIVVNSGIKWIIIAASSILVAAGGYFAFNSMAGGNNQSTKETESQSEVFDLDVASAAEYGISNSDLWNIEFTSDPSPIDYTAYRESDMGIFNKSCVTHFDVESAFKPGTSLRNTGFQSPETAENRYSVSEQLISFETEAAAKAAFDSIPTKDLSPNCDYKGSDGTTIHWVNSLSISEVLDAEGNGRYLPSITQWDVLGSSGQTQSAVVILQRGKVVSMITMQSMEVIDDVEMEIGINDLQLIAKSSILRFFKE
jgi:hypothetical protein